MEQIKLHYELDLEPNYTNVFLKRLIIYHC